ncbi:MAG: FAD-binding and (Fe-S)-binding domain-containing protein [Candidatus Nanopelagicaceae bacterium]|nr:FAD-binding and (Fe-S)-binding domain-containing protein [Candidatus Nanopelagicaceae bacterium]
MTSKSLTETLETILPGGVFDSIFDRKSMANDASHYLLTPQLVLRPKSAMQVGDLLRVSKEQNLGITFRSGGTSLSGQAVGSGLLVDTRRNFKEIEVLNNGNQVRVQPGVTVRQVNATLARYGKKLGPDPASEVACTVGGVVANNSSGMSCGTEFNTYSTLESMTLVLPSGTVIDTAQTDANEKLRAIEPLLYEGLLALRRRIHDRDSSVDRIRSLYSIKNTMGYSLNSFLDYSTPIDILAHLIVGSEGTLAFIAEVVFNTIPLLPKLATGLLIFGNLEDATKSLPDFKSSGAAVIELLDKSSLIVAQREHMADSVLAGVEFVNHAALLLEYQSVTDDELTQSVEVARKIILGLPIKPVTLSRDPLIRKELWHARKGLYAAVAGNRPSGTTAILEDIAVPMDALHETTIALGGLLNKHKYEGSVIFGHAKDGNLHFLLNENFDRPELLERYQQFTEDMVSLILGKSGSLKAEHGTGRIMAPYLRRQCGDELYEVMLQIKKLCDPDNILNPGVMISENHLVHIENLKVSPTVDAEVDRCVECGYCEPVCPSRDLTLTPRQRIVMRRALVDAEKSGDKELVGELNSRFDYDAVQTCAADSMCAVTCPVHIDTGTLVTRLRSEQQSRVPKKVGEGVAKNWGPVTSLLSSVLTIARKAPAPFVIGVNRLLRMGVGDDRLPLWNKELPGGGLVRKPIENQNADILYFPSCVNTLFGAPSGEINVQDAFLALCARVGVEVMIPEGIEGSCCATPWKSKGLMGGFEAMSGVTRERILKTSRDRKIPIVCDATSCTDGLVGLEKKDRSGTEILDVLSFIADQILPQLNVKEKLASIALHPTCSGTQLGLNESMTKIAHFVADEVYVPENWACCGFGGDRGLLHPELTESATFAEASEITSRTFSEYSSANRPCEIAMSQATGESYKHLLQVLERSSRP